MTLDVSPEISALSGETVGDAPVIAKRAAQSRVAIRDGQTIVIGGLMEDRTTDTVDKVPLLGDIPVLGALFRHSVKKKTKTELLIFLTPHVAQQPSDLEGMSESEASSKTIRGAVSEGALDEHLKAMQQGSPAAAAGPDKAEPEEKTQDETDDQGAVTK